MPPQRTVHLIGICGTGMGSLAGLLKDAGFRVRGSDQDVYPPISTMLEGMGIQIMKGYRPGNLDPEPDVVVVGNVVGRSNPEVVSLLERGVPYLSLPQALGEFILEGRHPVVVVGTHGKTTTAALMSHVLKAAGREPSFLVGGVLIGSERSYRLGSGPHVVVEGDEYETSFFDKGPKFLHYRPRTAILTSVEYDHAEMYPSIEAVEEAFRRFVAIIPEDGTLIACADDPRAARIARQARCHVTFYGLDMGVDTLERAETHGYVRGDVSASGPFGTMMEVEPPPPVEGVDDHPFGIPRAMWTEQCVRSFFRTPMTGMHNFRNALGVIAAARSLGLEDIEIGVGLSTFRGVHRRQEVVGEAAGVSVIDDFAHHPTAVRETIGAMKDRHGERRLWAIFEPRTNTTRRSVFQGEYAAAFDGADVTVIAAVDHPERAPEGQRFDPERLVADLRARGLTAHYHPDTDSIVARIAAEARAGDVLLVMSNGSFGGIHARLLAALRSR